MSAGAGRQSFSPEQRIRQGRDFQRAKAEGQRVAVGCVALNWVQKTGPGNRLGVITSRKIGGSVIRSRARRLLREAYRLNQQKVLGAFDLVLVARQSIVGKGFGDVERDFLAALKRARLLKEE